MNAKVQEILRKSAYNFAIKCGASEEEAIKAGEDKIKSTQRLIEEEENQKWVDITTGETHTPRNPY
jgi:hypothetical protein